jgi:hypothetical protein
VKEHPWNNLKAVWEVLTPYQKRKWKYLWTLFPRMVDVLPPGKVGQCEIYHFEVSPFDAYWNHQKRGELWTPGRFVQLNIGGVGWMYDILHERIMNEKVVREAHGDVLIGGLGIGMILHPILAKPEVTSVRVLENNLHIAELVAPSLSQVPGAQKLTVELADAAEWSSAQTFDTIWLDCVPMYGYSTAVLRLQQEWVRKFEPYLRPGGWISHWGLEENLTWMLEECWRRSGRSTRRRAFPLGPHVPEFSIHIDRNNPEAFDYAPNPIVSEVIR